MITVEQPTEQNLLCCAYKILDRYHSDERHAKYLEREAQTRLINHFFSLFPIGDSIERFFETRSRTQFFNEITREEFSPDLEGYPHHWHKLVTIYLIWGYNNCEDCPVGHHVSSGAIAQYYSDWEYVTTVIVLLPNLSEQKYERDSIQHGVWTRVA